MITSWEPFTHAPPSHDLLPSSNLFICVRTVCPEYPRSHSSNWNTWCHGLPHLFSFTLLLPCLRVFDPHSNYLHFHDASRRDLECTWSLPRVYPAQRDAAGRRDPPGWPTYAWRRRQAMNVLALFCRLTCDDQHSIITPERDHAC